MRTFATLHTGLPHIPLTHPFAHANAVAGLRGLLIFQADGKYVRAPYKQTPNSAIFSAPEDAVVTIVASKSLTQKLLVRANGP